MQRSFEGFIGCRAPRKAPGFRIFGFRVQFGFRVPLKGSCKGILQRLLKGIRSGLRLCLGLRFRLWDLRLGTA